MSKLTTEIEKLCLKNSDRKIAEPMAKYMRNKFEFLGLPINLNFSDCQDQRERKF